MKKFRRTVSWIFYPILTYVLPFMAASYYFKRVDRSLDWLVLMVISAAFVVVAYWLAPARKHRAMYIMTICYSIIMSIIAVVHLVNMGEAKYDVGSPAQYAVACILSIVACWVTYFLMVRFHVKKRATAGQLVRFGVRTTNYIFMGFVTLGMLILGLLYIAGLTVSSSNTSTPTKQEQVVKDKYDIGPPDPQEMVELINQERAKVGVAPLTLRQELNEGSRIKAQDMVDNNYFDHKMPSTGKSWNQAMEDVERPLCATSPSENITDSSGTFIEDRSTRRSFKSFEASPPHYKAMIDARYQYFGAAYHSGKFVNRFCYAKP